MPFEPPKRSNSPKNRIFQKFKFFEIQKFLEYIFSIRRKSKIESVLKWLILTSPLVYSRRQRHMARGPVCFGKKIEFPEVSLKYTGNFMPKIPTRWPISTKNYNFCSKTQISVPFSKRTVEAVNLISILEIKSKF